MAEVQGDLALETPLSHDRWALHVITQSFCARHHAKREGVTTIAYLHRLLLRDRWGLVVDYANRNTPDCQRNNLMLTTPAGNSQNKAVKNPKTRLGCTTCDSSTACARS